MGFKSDKQRKGFFANNNSNTSNNSKSASLPKNHKNMSYKQLKSKGVRLSAKGDADKDGVVNIKDCKPLNKKKQGFLHDASVKILQKREELAERKRQKELNKLEDLQEKIKARKPLHDKKLKVKQAQLQQKQTLIDELKREKDTAKKLKDANKQAKKDLDSLTATGRVKQRTLKGGRRLLVQTGQFLRDPKTRKAAKRFVSKFSDSPKGKRKKKKSKKKRKSNDISF